MKSNVNGNVQDIQRWCIVNDSTGEVVIQEEPAGSPELAAHLREQEKGIVSNDADFQTRVAQSAATQSILSIFAIALISIVYLF